MRRIFSGGLLVLTVVASGTLWLQRQVTDELRGEVALLRDENRQRAALRAENAKLTIAQPPAPELDRLRADHVALARMRGEIERLKTEIDRRGRALTHAALPLIPASEWKNAGRATPAAALETRMWAHLGGDTAMIADTMVLPPASRQKAEELFAHLPEAARAGYRTPEDLLAAAFAGTSGAQTVGLQVLSQQSGAQIDGMASELRNDPTYQTLHVQTQDANGAVRQNDWIFQQTDDGWKQVILPNTVTKAAGLIGAKPPSAAKTGGGS